MFKATVYCVGVKNGDESDFEFLLNNYNKQTDKTNKTNIIYGLSCSKDVSLLSKLLYNVNNNFDNDLVLSAIRNIAIRSNGNRIAWSFVKSNWDKLYEK